MSAIQNTPAPWTLHVGGVANEYTVLDASNHWKIADAVEAGASWSEAIASA